MLDFERVIEMKQEDDLTGQLKCFIKPYFLICSPGELGTTDSDKDPDRPMFSLTTGKYRYVKKYETGKYSFSPSI